MAAATSFRLNRRIHHRYVMVLCDGFLHAAGSRIPCVVRNISSMGLMARVYRKVSLGDAVTVELAGGQMFPGAVLWTREWDVGVAFAAPIEVDEILATQWLTADPADRRTSLRITVECPATLRVRRRFYYSRLCDLSPSGARIELASELKRKGDALLTLPDLPVIPADVRWAKDRQCGLSFKEQIPIEALHEWLQARGCSAD